ARPRTNARAQPLRGRGVAWSALELGWPTSSWSDPLDHGFRDAWRRRAARHRMDRVRMVVASAVLLLVAAGNAAPGAGTDRRRRHQPYGGRKGPIVASRLAADAQYDRSTAGGDGVGTAPGGGDPSRPGVTWTRCRGSATPCS